MGFAVERFNDSTVQRFDEGKPMIRSGIGYDIHRFAEGLKLILGGVEIVHPRGLEGHSDADVLSHAIADALLGAIGAGDIGQHFPNTDESIRGISSMEILKRVGNLLAEKNARVVNIDATVIAESPKLMPHVQAMRQKIASAIGVNGSEVSVKATTNEKLGPIGQGEGIAAIAMATIEIVGRDRRARRKRNGGAGGPSLPN
jgi:2-C-methyl-D-erythritol 2,4-cyclodiphosphate synthase